MRTLLLIAFMVFDIMTMKAPNTNKMETKQTDSIAIAQALENYYFKGIYEGDVQTLGYVFNKGRHIVIGRCKRAALC